MKKLFVMKKKSVLVLTLLFTILLSCMSLGRVYGAKAIDVTAKGSITVGLAATNTYEELKTNDIAVTFYRVASVDEYGEYTGLVPSFDADLIGSDTNASTWSDMAKAVEADSALKDCEQLTATIQDGKNATVQLPENMLGMYLMLVSEVETDAFSYAFAPALIAVPGNGYYTYDAEGNPSVREDADDSWTYDVSTVLKPEYQDLYGNLVIHKTLDTFNTSLNGTSFVYKVTAYKDYAAIDRYLNDDEETGMLVYSNVVTIDFDKAGTQSVVIEHIPAGAQVSVEEVYTGATYQVTSDATQTATIVKDTQGENASVDFSNTYDHTLDGNGTAVVNHFHYTANEDEMTGSWSWSGEMEDAPVEEPVRE